MKKFRFNLQRILSIKERQEDLLKQELSRLLYRQRQHKKVKHYYEDLQDQEFDLWRNKASFTQDEHTLSKNYRTGLENNIYSQVLMIRDYEIKVQKKRQEIYENRKEIKTLEKLKERQWENYQYEAMQEERKDMDEIANRSSFSKR